MAKTRRRNIKKRTYRARRHHRRTVKRGGVWPFSPPPPKLNDTTVKFITEYVTAHSAEVQNPGSDHTENKRIQNESVTKIIDAVMNDQAQQEALFKYFTDNSTDHLRALHSDIEKKIISSRVNTSVKTDTPEQ